MHICVHTCAGLTFAAGATRLRMGQVRSDAQSGLGDPKSFSMQRVSDDACNDAHSDQLQHCTPSRPSPRHEREMQMLAIALGSVNPPSEPSEVSSVKPPADSFPALSQGFLPAAVHVQHGSAGPQPLVPNKTSTPNTATAPAQASAQQDLFGRPDMEIERRLRAAVFGNLARGSRYMYHMSPAPQTPAAMAVASTASARQASSPCPPETAAVGGSGPGAGVGAVASVSATTAPASQVLLGGVVAPATDPRASSSIARVEDPPADAMVLVPLAVQETNARQEAVQEAVSVSGQGLLSGQEAVPAQALVHMHEECAAAMSPSFGIQAASSPGPTMQALLHPDMSMRHSDSGMSGLSTPNMLSPYASGHASQPMTAAAILGADYHSMLAQGAENSAVTYPNSAFPPTVTVDDQGMHIASGGASGTMPHQLLAVTGQVADGPGPAEAHVWPLTWCRSDMVMDNPLHVPGAAWPSGPRPTVADMLPALTRSQEQAERYMTCNPLFREQA